MCMGAKQFPFRLNQPFSCFIFLLKSHHIELMLLLAFLLVIKTVLCTHCLRDLLSKPFFDYTYCSNTFVLWINYSHKCIFDRMEWKKRKKVYKSTSSVPLIRLRHILSPNFIDDKVKDVLHWMKVCIRPPLTPFKQSEEQWKPPRFFHIPSIFYSVYVQHSRKKKNVFNNK